MAINRFKLIHEILKAQEEHNVDLYNELLGIYYRILQQEEISENYIEEFNIYSEISVEAKQKLQPAMV